MNRRKSLGVGSVSLILIFCVLCLTVFALLTLSSARSENELAKRLANAVDSYYAADLAAAQAYGEIKQAVQSGGRPETVGDSQVTYLESGEGLYIYFLTPVDDNRDLAVQALYADEEFAVLQWLVAENGSWQPDDRLPVLFSDEDEE